VVIRAINARRIAHPELSKMIIPSIAMTLAANEAGGGAIQFLVLVNDVHVTASKCLASDIISPT
jgi:hypothetical protein